jgi:hypothetical protein
VYLRDRAAVADTKLRNFRSQYESLEALIHSTRRLANERNALCRKEQAITALRRDQRAANALRTLASLSNETIWFQRVQLEEARPEVPEKPAARSGFHVRPAVRTSSNDPVAAAGRPLRVNITGFALNQQEFSEFFSRLRHNERFVGVDLRRSSRAPFLEGQAVKFVIVSEFR